MPISAARLRRPPGASPLRSRCLSPISRITRPGFPKMIWLLLLATAVVWVVSYCKILYFSNASLSNGAAFPMEAGKKSRNVLLVIAHPDDESMFFSPTLLSLASQNHNVHILCISIGNADGKGEVRKRELCRACAILKVPQENIKILDHPDLQDGFGNLWDLKMLENIISNEVDTRNIDLIITFDDYGVSGHCNHRDVHRGLRKFLSENSAEKIETWELRSKSILRKYIGPVDVWLSILDTVLYGRGQLTNVVNVHPQKCYLAMAEHESQWIWFRKLFVLFSSYSYVNVLRKIS